MEIVYSAVEIFFGAIGFFDGESVKGFGVENAFDLAVDVGDGETSEARLVEFVEGEGTKNFVGANKNHFGFGKHEVLNGTIVETHDGGNAVAVFAR